MEFLVEFKNDNKRWSIASFLRFPLESVSSSRQRGHILAIDGLSGTIYQIGRKYTCFLTPSLRLGINILTSELVCLVGADDDWPGSCVWPNTPDWSKPISLNPSNENLGTKWRGWTKKVIDQLSFTFFTKVPIGCIVIIKDLAITDIISTYYLFKDIVLQYVVKNKIYCFLVFLRMSWTKDDAYWWNIL